MIEVSPPIFTDFGDGQCFHRSALYEARTPVGDVGISGGSPTRAVLLDEDSGSNEKALHSLVCIITMRESHGLPRLASSHFNTSHCVRRQYCRYEPRLDAEKGTGKRVL